MKIERRIEGLLKLFDNLNSFKDKPDLNFLEKVKQSNQWFIPEFVLRSMDGILKFLDAGKIEEWISAYRIKEGSPRKVGIIMAGNIPFVGFHDLLSVILSGHHAVIKTSHQDTVLSGWVVDMLFNIDPGFKSIITLSDRMKNTDALIATGSDNSARFFRYYFINIPSIIRYNRSSIGIIKGEEHKNTLNSLADDIFLYFGLGCRNVSKLFIPKGYKIETLLSSLKNYRFLAKHKGYLHNYLYQKAINSVSETFYIDGEFCILKRTNEFISPISVIYFEEYENENQLYGMIEAQKNRIQCIISNDYPNSILPGKSQYPELWDYSDNVDTMEFLTNLS